MKKGEIVTGIVERVDFPNKGIVRVDELLENGEQKTSYCVVKNVIPGQKISLMVKKMKRKPTRIPERSPEKGIQKKQLFLKNPLPTE